MLSSRFDRCGRVVGELVVPSVQPRVTARDGIVSVAPVVIVVGEVTKCRGRGVSLGAGGVRVGHDSNNDGEHYEKQFHLIPLTEFQSDDKTDSALQQDEVLTSEGRAVVAEHGDLR